MFLSRLQLLVSLLEALFEFVPAILQSICGNQALVRKTRIRTTAGPLSQQRGLESGGAGKIVYRSDGVRHWPNNVSDEKFLNLVPGSADGSLTPMHCQHSVRVAVMENGLPQLLHGLRDNGGDEDVPGGGCNH